MLCHVNTLHGTAMNNTIRQVCNRYWYLGHIDDRIRKTSLSGSQGLIHGLDITFLCRRIDVRVLSLHSFANINYLENFKMLLRHVINTYGSEIFKSSLPKVQNSDEMAQQFEQGFGLSRRSMRLAGALK